MRPRLTSAAAFPHAAKAVCYFALVDGIVHAVRTDRELIEAVGDAGEGGSVRLYAVWPGRHRSDLFLVDDLDMLASRLGIIAPAAP